MTRWFVQTQKPSEKFNTTDLFKWTAFCINFYAASNLINAIKKLHKIGWSFLWNEPHITYNFDEEQKRTKSIKRFEISSMANQGVYKHYVSFC